MAEFAKEILDVLKFLEHAFGQTLSADQARAYVAGLSDVNPVQLCAAAEKFSRTMKFFPKISELRKESTGVLVIPSIGLIRERQALIDKFWKTGVLDGEGFDRLYGDARRAGYWGIADYVAFTRLQLGAVVHVQEMAFMAEIGVN